MPAQKRELYASPNGDKWYLARESETGRLFVRHKANLPSGGQVTDIDIGAFLRGGRRHPEHQALLRMIGTWLKTIPSALRGKAGELGYPTTAEVDEATAAQIPARNPSNKSDIMIKDTPVPN